MRWGPLQLPCCLPWETSLASVLRSQACGTHGLEVGRASTHLLVLLRPLPSCQDPGQAVSTLMSQQDEWVPQRRAKDVTRMVITG